MKKLYIEELPENCNNCDYEFAMDSLPGVFCGFGMDEIDPKCESRLENCPLRSISEKDDEIRRVTQCMMGWRDKVQVLERELALKVEQEHEKDKEISKLRRVIDNLKSELRFRYGASQGLEDIFKQCGAEVEDEIK